MTDDFGVHLIVVIIGVLVGAAVGGIGSYLASSFKMAKKLIVLEKSVSDYHANTDRRVTWLEGNTVKTNECDECEEKADNKIEARHEAAIAEARKIRELAAKEMSNIKEKLDSIENRVANNGDTVEDIAERQSQVLQVISALATKIGVDVGIIRGKR